MDDFTTSDVDLLYNWFRKKPVLQWGEMRNEKGISYLEGYVHEIAHLVDIGVPIAEAVQYAGTWHQVSDRLRAYYRNANTFQRDGNEIRATAITVITLSCCQSYSSSDSFNSMFDNVHGYDLGQRYEFNQTVRARYEAAKVTKAAYSNAMKIRSFLHSELKKAKASSVCG